VILENLEVALTGKRVSSSDLKKVTREARNGNGFRFEGGWLSLEEINVLGQPRETFEDIDLLGTDIKDKGLLNPPAVARFYRHDCRKYLKLNEDMYARGVHLRDLKASVDEKGKKCWYILLAGERRFRACSQIWAEGCPDCLEEYGEEESGICFHRHFGRHELEVRLCLNIPIEAAVDLQFSENTHMRVPPAEEARAYATYFGLLKANNPDLTLSRFARKVSRRPETIRKALRFCALPDEIRRLTKGGDTKKEAEKKREEGSNLISYGIAIELARLQEFLKTGEKEDVSDSITQKLHWWATKAIAGGYSVPEFRRIISEHIEEKQSQVSMFPLSDEDEVEELKRSVRMTVQKESVRGLIAYSRYLRYVLGLFKQNRLGYSDSPFAEGSPVRQILTVVGLLEEILPHLRMCKLMSRGKLHRTKVVCQEVKKEAGEFLEILEGDT